MSGQRKLLFLGVAGVAVTLVAGALVVTSGAEARTGGAVPNAAPSGFPVQYSAPFVCGWLPPVPPQDDRHLKPGDYATAINIHNPSDVWVAGSKQVSLFYAMGTPPPPVIPPKNFSVARKRLLEIDCTDIWSMAGLPPGSFVKGAVHIGLAQQLPMAGIYASQTHPDPAVGPDAGAGISIDVEHIPPFQVSVPG